MRLRALFGFACGLGLLSAWAGPASAAPRRWAIGEIRVEGDLDEAARAAVEERSWRALSLALPTDALLAPHDAVAAALAATPGLRGCADDRCSLALGDRLGVERLITVRIERRGDGWTAHLLSFAVDAAQVAGTLELPCPDCSADALMDAFARAAAPLLRDERARALCTLTVTAPPGAAVSLDTVLLGEAPFVHTVAAGRHTVAAAGAQAEVDCPAGAARAVQLAGSGGSSRRTWQIGLGAAAVVLAAGSLAGLITAAAYQDRAACDGRCAYRYDATTGIVLGAVGVALFGGAAAALFAIAHRPATHAATGARERAALEAAVRLQLTPTGVPFRVTRNAAEGLPPGRDAAARHRDDLAPTARGEAGATDRGAPAAPRGDFVPLTRAALVPPASGLTLTGSF